MTSSRRSICWSLIPSAFLGVLLWSEHSHGVTKEIPTSPEMLVKEALHREIYGLIGERRQLLSDAARIDSLYGPARWHQGFIQSRGQWVDVETLAGEGQTELLKQYVAMRATCRDTVDDQIRLANWCRDQQLPLQERAHLSRVIDLNGDHTVARERLGFRRVSGRWLTETEIAATLGRRKLEEDAAKRWREELLEINRDLQQSNPTKQEAARARLAAIDDQHAIPAMEALLSVSGQEGALAVVAKLGNVKGQEAVESLIRHAVFSQWPLVRQAAAERLKERKLASFVPFMLREMYTPLESRFGISQLRDGRIVYTHAFAREGQEEQQVLRLDTAFNRIKIPDGDVEDSLMRAFEASVSGVNVRQQQMAWQNAVQQAYNQRLVEALRIATYQDLPSDPKVWWQWWDKHNDVVRLSNKQVRSQYQVQQVAIVDRSYTRPSDSGSFSPASQNRPTRPSSTMRRSTFGSPGLAALVGECFAAGTVVWTRYGEQPIESIRIGDLVLAQDVESGELAFKPVLGTTLRPAEELVQVRVGKDTLECTRGHLFWVSGHGWAKADRLESGLALHCVRGASPISSVDTGLKVETHNLIVADFHTYFVGRERILSHDVTQMNPTDAVVPGLKDD